MEIYNFSSYFQIFSTLAILYGWTSYLKDYLFNALKKRLENKLKFQKSLIYIFTLDFNKNKENKIHEMFLYELAIKNIKSRIEYNQNLLDSFLFSCTITSLFCLSLLVIGGIQQGNYSSTCKLTVLSVIMSIFVILCNVINFIASLNYDKNKFENKRLDSIIIAFVFYLLIIIFSYYLVYISGLDFFLYEYFTNKLWVHILLIATPTLIYLFSILRLLIFGYSIHKSIVGIEIKSKVVEDSLTNMLIKKNNPSNW